MVSVQVSKWKTRKYRSLTMGEEFKSFQNFSMGVIV